jgi:hypothetical protein
VGARPSGAHLNEYSMNAIFRPPNNASGIAKSVPRTMNNGRQNRNQRDSETRKSLPVCRPLFPYQGILSVLING